MNMMNNPMVAPVIVLQLRCLLSATDLWALLRGTKALCRAALHLRLRGPLTLKLSPILGFVSSVMKGAPPSHEMPSISAHEDFKEKLMEKRTVQTSMLT